MAKHARQPEQHGQGGYPYQQNTTRFPDQPHDRYSTASPDYSRPSYQRDSPAAAGYPFSQRPASDYSRDAYADWWENEERGNHARRRRRHPVLKGILVFILVVLLACGAAVAWYAHEFDSRLAANQSTPEEMADVLTPASAGEPYYVLLLGSDWRENSGTSKRADQSGDNQRSDVMVLARVDADANQVTLVSVPRDTRWEHDGTVSKINEAYNIGGAALTTQAVSELTGVSIAHTVEIHFSGLESLVDSLGGVAVDVPQAISYRDALTGEKVTVEAGKQVLDGQQAQIFSRVRKAYGGQDSTRQGNVRQLIGAIADSIREKPVLEWPELGLKVADCFGTDMRFLDFVGLLLGFNDGKLTMYAGTGPTLGAIDAAAGGIWLCYDNPEGWKRVMDVVNAGGDPSTVNPDLEFAGRGDVNVDDAEPVYVEEESYEPVTEAPAEYYDYPVFDDVDGYAEEYVPVADEPAAEEVADAAAVPIEEAAAADAAAVDGGGVSGTVAGDGGDGAAEG